MTAAEWSEPFHGITHLGSPDDYRWATVQERGEFAEMMKWSRGAGFSCECYRFGSVDEAKSAGETWVQRGV